ncbi:uncharacterized protein LOC116704719 [Etheostoma spectabile]|uniref:uncharacterized protein LOC116704719 n=1 Tax=Etheostoma spectabile TaxID=54343 RepID=UPI0013AF5B13|nr:uncharacterized protein LOC116704719 [Etheostoma spectabile]
MEDTRGITNKVAPQQTVATPENTPSGAAQQVYEASEMIRGPVQRKTLWKAPTPYRTLRDASPKVSGQVGGPQQAAATPECVSPPSGAAQQAGEASELSRGPVQRKTLWKPTQPHRAPKHEGLARIWAGKVEADCYKRGPVQRKILWTPTPPSPQEHSGRVSDYGKPRWTAPQFSLLANAISSEAKASGDEASDFKSCLMQQKDICTAPHTTEACEEVEASSQHAMTVDPELQPLQLSSHEKEEITTLKEKNEALRSSLQQASFKKEESIKLKEENKALTAEVEQLKEKLKVNNVLHDEVNQKNVKKISDLEVQLLFKTASEDNTRHEKEQMEEALQRQKESQRKQKSTWRAREENQRDPPQTIPKTVLTKKTDTLQGGKPQQAPTSTDAPQPAAIPEVAPPQASAAPKGSVQQAATPKDLPQKATPNPLKVVRWKDLQKGKIPKKVAPQQRSYPEKHLRAARRVFDPEDQRPCPRKTLLENPNTPRTLEMFTEGFLDRQKDICTAPHTTEACEEVEASSQHAMTVDPELQPLQLSSHEKEEITTLKEKNEALRSSLQQASFKKEESIKLKEENKALTAEVEQLKEKLKVNNVLHDEVNQKNVKKISDLEVQLLFKTASEDNTRHEKEQMEEALQRQKESQKETEVYLAEQREENHALMVKLAQALSNLESQQLQWQEERTRLLQSLSDIQDTLQETTCSGVKEETDDQGEATLSQPKGNAKPKKPSLWRRFLRLFK